MEIPKKKATIVNDPKSGGSKGAGRLIRNLLITLAAGLVYFYFALPAINLHDPSFYGFFFLMAALFCVLTLLGSIGQLKDETEPKAIWKTLKQTCAVPLYLCIGLIVIYLVGSLLSSVILRSDAYTKLLPVEPGDFSADVQEISFDKIPLLDKSSAERLGDRKLGELSDMVSQFEVNEDYDQINYNGKPVRVATLRYGDMFKWFNNVRDGLPAYLIIDMIEQDVEVVRLSDLGMGGIRYSLSDHFGRYLMRHLRFSYPTFMFDAPHFEIDDEGNPYWICPKIEKTIGLFGGTDINGAVLVNAVTGESQYLQDVPTWVDQLYTAELIIEQYNYYGQYGNGFLNAFFGQKGVTVTTDGYNYIALDDDVYVYTGVTSVGGDQSNLGFVLTNQRTKETRYYTCAGADEYSARDSAEGKVQHLKYTSTFPILLNISNQPTYFMALKDAAGLVKMYAMVNVQQYNIVGTGTTVAECEAAYHDELLHNDLVDGTQVSSSEVSGTIEDIRSAVIGGNSIYYLKLTGHNCYYAVSAADSEVAVILSVGDSVTVLSGESEGDIRDAISVTLK